MGGLLPAWADAGRAAQVDPADAERLSDGNMQTLQQFVSQSTWDHVPVLRSVATKAASGISPEAWVIDDTSFPKAGDQSVRAARQWCGALGKKSLCQVGVSLHAVTDAASVPPNWRLFLPAEWADPDDERRAKAGVPDGLGHRAKWRLALDAIDEALGWGLAGRVVVADAGYGQMHAFRAAVADRGLDYVVAVRGDTSVPTPARRCRPCRNDKGGWAPRYREPARSLKDLVTTAGRRRLRRCTWRQGSKGAMTSRFIVLEVRPAGVAPTKAGRERAGGRGGWDGVLPAETLIAEWPPHQDEPTDYWLTNLPADTALRHLVRMAKIRWRIEHDYRELKHGLGLDHFETLRCLDPKAQAPA